MSKSKKAVIIITSIIGTIAAIAGVMVLIARKVSRDLDNIDLTSCEIEI